jgi:hypothetical protein
VPQRLDLLEFLLALLKLVAWLKLQRKILSEVTDSEYSGLQLPRARNCANLAQVEFFFQDSLKAREFWLGGIPHVLREQVE